MLAVFSALPNWSLHAELLIHFASTPAWITLFCFDMSFCVMPILLSCERKGPDDRFYDHLRCLFALESVSSNQAHQSFLFWCCTPQHGCLHPRKQAFIICLISVYAQDFPLFLNSLGLVPPPLNKCFSFSRKIDYFLWVNRLPPFTSNCHYSI